VRRRTKVFAALTGEPIRISAKQDLRCSRGQIFTGRGTHVHAATFIRQRLIVLDADLLRSDVELRRILIHELFHFVWVRLGNPARRSFEELLCGQRRVSGELGWSAEYRKLDLAARDIRQRSRKWREYCCEAFCDTAAYLYARSKRHDEFTLPADERRKRIVWFGKNLGARSVRI
jgi:hypothetical protein